MMSSRKVLEYVATEPFVPFRIKMASGQSFDIRHPEMILIGKLSVRIYCKRGPGAGDAMTWQDVSLLHMESIEPIELSLEQANS